MLCVRGNFIPTGILPFVRDFLPFSLASSRWLFIRSIVEYMFCTYIFHSALKAHSLRVIVETCVSPNAEPM